MNEHLRVAARITLTAAVITLAPSAASAQFFSGCGRRVGRACGGGCGFALAAQKIQ